MGRSARDTDGGRGIHGGRAHRPGPDRIAGCGVCPVRPDTGTGPPCLRRGTGTRPSRSRRHHPTGRPAPATRRGTRPGPGPGAVRSRVAAATGEHRRADGGRCTAAAPAADGPDQPAGPAALELEPAPPAATAPDGPAPDHLAPGPADEHRNSPPDPTGEHLNPPPDPTPEHGNPAPHPTTEHGNPRPDRVCADTPDPHDPPAPPVTSHPDTLTAGIWEPYCCCEAPPHSGTAPK
ncbi:hypothetical protein ACQPZA_16275 [Pseudonocardia xinjiangensis]|uniref:hypothetical protein n=1 Tax=Pseudonocardia xinjiangensis TaxID=75289 RepID=UPI003D90460F